MSFGSASHAKDAAPEHVLHYHAERDGDERAVLRAFDWVVKPLLESDAQ